MQKKTWHTERRRAGIISRVDTTNSTEANDCNPGLLANLSFYVWDSVI